MDFLLNPKNTPLWIDSIVTETTNHWPVREGTVYRHQTRDGAWHEYTLTSLDPMSRHFILKAHDGNYHVRYTLTPVSEQETEIEYFEWVIRGHLVEPLSKNSLDRLKEIIESL